MFRQGKRIHSLAFPEMQGADLDSPGSSFTPAPPPSRPQQEGAMSHNFFIPGQWDEPEYDELPAAPVATVAPEAPRVAIFTTAFRIFPGWLRSIVTPIARIFNRFAAHQVIRAEAVVSDNGGRKRILLDAGADKAPETSSPTVAPLNAFTPGNLLNSILDEQEAASLSPSRPVPVATHRAAAPKFTSPRGKKNLNNNKALNIGRSSSESHPKLFVGTATTRKLSPIAVRRAPAAKVEQLHAPNRRVHQLAHGHANHTTSSEEAPRRPGLITIKPKSVAHQIRAEEVAKKAHDDELIRRENAKDRAQVVATLPTPETDEDKPVWQQIMKCESDLSDIEPFLLEDDEPEVQPAVQPAVEQEAQPSDYQNDLSDLEDAPPAIKTVSFEPTARVRQFHNDSRVDELLESSFADVFSPPMALLPPPEEPFSVELKMPDLDAAEVSVEFKMLDIDDVSPIVFQPEPTPTPEPVFSLLPELQEDKLATIYMATRASHNGLNLNARIGTGKVSVHNMKTLLPNEFNGNASAWVNDDIVNDFLALLTDRAKKTAGYVDSRTGPPPPFHAFASQWFITASQDMTKVKRWAFRKNLGGAKLLDARLLLFPICDGNHWRLLAIKPKYRTIEYFDSLHMNGAKYLRLARAYLKQELGTLWHDAEWRDIQGRSMAQANGSDCGVFACLNALALIRDEDPSRVAVDNGMLQARCHIAAALLTEDVTTLLP